MSINDSLASSPMTPPAMAPLEPLVFLLDVDNTLLDNDRFGADLDARLEQSFGGVQRARYRAIYDRLRDELGYADYLGALQQLRTGLGDDPALLQMSAFLLDYPFAERYFPHALDTVAYLRTLGPTAILSDGDVVFQPRKVQRSGLWDAVEGRVLISVHKELMLSAVQRRFPAAHYVMIDDKPQVLARMKLAWGDTLTTVFVRQGHYAAESAQATIDPAPDRVVDGIGELRGADVGFFTLPTHEAAIASAQS